MWIGDFSRHFRNYHGLEINSDCIKYLIGKRINCTNSKESEFNYDKLCTSKKLAYFGYEYLNHFKIEEVTNIVRRFFHLGGDYVLFESIPKSEVANRHRLGEHGFVFSNKVYYQVTDVDELSYKYRLNYGDSIFEQTITYHEPREISDKSNSNLDFQIILDNSEIYIYGK